MSAASYLAKAGYDVTVIEKHNSPGGRARRLIADGFTFDMGPSWYWMPDVFEKYFQNFGKKTSDYYKITRLDPSYRIYWANQVTDIPANYEKLKVLFESIESGSSAQLDMFLNEAAYKYKVGMHKLAYKPGQSVAEFLNWDIIKGVFRLDVFTSMQKHVAKYFKHSMLRQLMEFPVLFLGALAEKTPALYSLMNYADIKLGTWFPQGGMYSIVTGMHNLAEELGVKFLFNHNVTAINIHKGKATGVLIQPEVQSKTENSLFFDADIVIGAADYHFIEHKLLPTDYRNYSQQYWNKKNMAPSCILYYVGINKKLSNITHHSLFFDADFNRHGQEIYTNPQWPTEPLFYVNATSVTDSSTAPVGHENLFFLIPVAPGLENDTSELLEKYFEKIINRFENKTGEKIRNHIVFKKAFSTKDFLSEYNSFKGNAYGLANTLWQTAIFKPCIQNKKVKNIFYTGQLTVPGPGVPPALISGQIVAGEITKRA